MPPIETPAPVKSKVDIASLIKKAIAKKKET